MLEALHVSHDLESLAMTRILIVEDHALVREAMLQSLRQLSDEVECVEAADANAALRHLEAQADWDLMLIDLMLPDMSGFSLLAITAKRFPDVPTLVVSAVEDPAAVRRAQGAGASGFVHKSASGAAILEVCRKVLDGGVHFPDGVAAARSTRSALDERFGLTAAQMRVVELLAQGKTNREIGDLLGLSEGTIKVHMSNIFKALKVSNRAQALLLIKRYQPRL